MQVSRLSQMATADPVTAEPDPGNASRDRLPPAAARTFPAQHRPLQDRGSREAPGPRKLPWRFRLAWRLLLFMERKHAPHVRIHHAMRIHHGNRLGRKYEMPGISGKDRPPRLPLPAAEGHLLPAPGRGSRGERGDKPEQRRMGTPVSVRFPRIGSFYDRLVSSRPQVRKLSRFRHSSHLASPSSHM
jgi:hypothetical protein